MKDLGATVVDVSIPHMRYGIAAYYVVANAEASSNLARYDGVKYGYRAPDASDLDDLYARTRSVGFGAEVKRRVMLGTYALSAGYVDRYYRKAQEVRLVIAAEFARVFRDVDAIVAPTSPTVAFRLGERAPDPLAMYLSDVYTVPANLAGIAAISVPCGFSEDELPVGLQIMADRFREPTMFRIASAYERAAAVARRPPGL
jgi:aspartyl-tRNA(Asn)/glutamyl-tRNA(Gln) amidotransferase subunit A